MEKNNRAVAARQIPYTPSLNPDKNIIAAHIPNITPNSMARMYLFLIIL